MQEKPRPDAQLVGALFTATLLLGLVLILLTPWIRSGRMWGPMGNSSSDAVINPLLSDFHGQMLHPLLLPALGMFWLLRRGKLDLSVWASFALGCGAAAQAARWGGHPAWLLAAAVGAGLIVGMWNLLLVRLTRAPVWMVTGLTAVLAVSLVAAITGPASVRVSPALLGRLTGQQAVLLATAGMFFVGALGIALSGYERGPLGVALVGSSVLSALGGLCWLGRSAEAVALPFPVGDPRVFAAAVLGGALVLAARGRLLHTLVFLPPAMLLATLWRYSVWDFAGCGYGWNVLMLAGLVLGGQWALKEYLARPGRWSLAAAGLCLLGIFLLAGSAWQMPPATRWILRIAGLGVWAVGASITALGYLSRHGRFSPEPGTIR